MQQAFNLPTELTAQLDNAVLNKCVVCSLPMPPAACGGTVNARRMPSSLSYASALPPPYEGKTAELAALL